MNRIIKIILPTLLLMPLLASAAMQPMDEDELALTSGQALFEVQDQLISQPISDPLRMVKLTIGARIEMNSNIEELTLGRYWRPEGTNCTGGAGGNKICYNNVVPAGYNDNINWACTVKPCGSVGLSNSDYIYSSKTHSESGTFFDALGGFQPDSGVDIKLRDVTMGRIVDGVLEPLVQENPYLEFAFDKDQLVGFRIGFEETYGYQGNIIDVISGYIRPTIKAQAKLVGIGVGTISLEASLGGVRTIGWLDQKTVDLRETGGLTGLLVSDPDSLVKESPHPQLFPVQSNFLNHTKGFFISMGIRQLQWSNTLDFTPNVTSPGFWLNMGGDNSLMATTQQGKHPVNYFPNHPKYAIYGGNQNYKPDGMSLPKFTETYQ